MKAKALPEVEYHTEDGLPDGEGCIRLFREFWDGVHFDLAPTPLPRRGRGTRVKHTPSAIAFVLRPDSTFAVWCSMAGQDPQTMREKLILDYAGTFIAWGYEAAVYALREKYPDHPVFNPRATKSVVR